MPVESRTWNEIEFDDHRPPSEVFSGYLSEIYDLIDIGPHKPPMLDNKPAEMLDVPASLLEVADGKWSATESAWLYQFLGVLAPENAGRARERFFERSLVALRYVSSSNKDYRLLKARAYFYLNKRPVSKQVLGQVKGHQEKSLSALLDGDLYSLEKHSGSISMPLAKLISEIELSRLRIAYDHPADRKRIQPLIDSVSTEWQQIISRAFFENDSWLQQSNVYIKKSLDTAFPVAGVTAESLLSKLVAFNPTPEGLRDIAFSVRAHFKAMSDQGKMPDCCQYNGFFPSSWDILELLEAIADSNLLRSMELEIITRGSPQNAVSLFELLEPVYEGHPGITWLYSKALADAALDASGFSRKHMQKESVRNAERAYVWAGGQTRYSMNAAVFLLKKNVTVYPLYNADFPNRSYWFPNMPSVDVANAENASGLSLKSLNLERRLAYLDYDFSLLVRAEQVFPSSDPVFAKALEECKEGRFSGHPERLVFLSKLEANKGNKNEAMSILYGGIDNESYSWAVYEKLATLLIGSGEVDEAVDVLWRYPPFKESAEELDESSVSVSNNAYRAGTMLLQKGEVDESLRLFLVAAQTKTGAQSKLYSSQIVEVSKLNFAEAAELLRLLSSRYNDQSAMVKYIMLLDAFGYSSLSDALLKKMSENFPTEAIVRIILNRQRIDGVPVTGKDLVDILAKEGLMSRSMAESNLEEAEILSTVIDRAPAQSDIARLDQGARERAPRVLFVTAYSLVLSGRFSEADELLKPCFTKRNKNLSGVIGCPYVLPLMTWAAIQSDRIDAVKRFLDKGGIIGGRFGYLLSRAMVAAASGNHGLGEEYLVESIEYIREEEQAFKAVLVSYWLYKMTGSDVYKRYGLSIAKRQQLKYVAVGWFYAAEAIFTDDASDRLPLIGIALHLDRESYLLSLLPEEEVEEAKEWLRFNNPFDERGAQKGFGV